MDEERVNVMKMEKRHYDAMLIYVKQALPKEACGILLGTVSKATAEVKEVKPMPNLSDSSYLFTADPEQLYQVLVEAESKGLEMIGIYHSHPLDSQPSSIDLTYMRLSPVIWVIISVPFAGDMRVAAYQYLGGKLHKVKLEVV